MAKKFKVAYWWGFSDARGIDRAYERDRKDAEREFQATFAGPQAIHEISVATDDPEMKNPDGEFNNPAPMVESEAERALPGWDSRGDRFKDPEGQQGAVLDDSSMIEPPMPDVEPYQVNYYPDDTET